MQIPVDKIGKSSAAAAKSLIKLIEDTGVKIDIEDDGMVYIASVDADSAEKAKKIIEGIVRDIEVGDVYTGKITRIMNFGAFMELPNARKGSISFPSLRMSASKKWRTSLRSATPSRRRSSKSTTRAA
jgi:polyribonucleotide nucleotidyltransferase